MFSSGSFSVYSESARAVRVNSPLTVVIDHQHPGLLSRGISLHDMGDSILDIRISRGVDLATLVVDCGHHYGQVSYIQTCVRSLTGVLRKI